MQFNVAIGVVLLVTIVSGALHNRVKRIVGGSDASIESLPYLLALEWTNLQYCGAIIISDRFAITAGHCVEDFEWYQLKVRTNSSLRNEGGTLIQVKGIFKNSRFSIDTMDYDVAILEFEEPLIFGVGSQPIVLGEQEPTAGQEVIVSGWGSTETNGPASPVLRAVTVPVVDRAQCKENYGAHGGGVTTRMFCAGAEGQDTCHNDSGGPVTLQGRLVGVTSWGLGCGAEGFPGVYTNLMEPDIREFIRSTTDL